MIYPLRAKWWKWGFYFELFSFIGFGVDLDHELRICFTMAKGQITLTIGLQK